jgi:hypothetical protein
MSEDLLKSTENISQLIEPICRLQEYETLSP